MDRGAWRATVHGTKKKQKDRIRYNLVARQQQQNHIEVQQMGMEAWILGNRLPGFKSWLCHILGVQM